MPKTMLPPNNTEAGLAQQEAERQTNYLILRSLESKLPVEQFRTLLNQVSLLTDFYDLARLHPT